MLVGSVSSLRAGADAVRVLMAVNPGMMFERPGGVGVCIFLPRRCGDGKRAGVDPCQSLSVSAFVFDSSHWCKVHVFVSGHVMWSGVRSRYTSSRGKAGGTVAKARPRWGEGASDFDQLLWDEKCLSTSSLSSLTVHRYRKHVLPYREHLP